MEKFALLDFLKAFQSLSAAGNGNQVGNGTAEKEPSQPSAPKSAPQQPPPQPEFYESNVMANVLSRHEEIANRVKNKK